MGFGGLQGYFGNESGCAGIGIVALREGISVRRNGNCGATEEEKGALLTDLGNELNGLSAARAPE